MAPDIEPPYGYKAKSPTWVDLEAVWQLVRAHEAADEERAEVELDDLRGDWERARFDLAEDAWVVVAPDGTLAAYGDVWPREGYTVVMADGYVHPSHRGRGLGRWLVQTMEGRAREIALNAPPGERVVLQNIVFHPVQAARELLESEGYHTERFFWRMVIDMDEAPPEPDWPDGLRPRRYAGGDERAIHELIQRSFADNAGYQRSPFEEWQAVMMGRASFNPELWYVVEADGRIIAAALCPDYEGHGWIRQFAVDREYRRRGIGLALLRHVFRDQFLRGNRQVGLVVHSYNRTGAKAVYERAGMHVERQHDAYQKELRPGR